MVSAIVLLTGSRALTERQVNILFVVQSAGRSTRQEIARALSLPVPTVNRIVSDLRDEGYLLEDQTEVRLVPGRPNASVQINARVSYAIGVDLRAEFWSWAICDANLREIARSGPIPHDLAVSAAAVTKIIDLLRLEVAGIALAWEEISNIVFAVHAIVTATGDIFLHYDARQSAFNIDQIATGASGKRCTSNDPARMYAVVERDSTIDGQDAAYLLFGRRGLGMGITVCGQTLRSFNGICGEIGHLAVGVGSSESRPPTVGERTNGDILVGEALALQWGRDLAVRVNGRLCLADICSAARLGHEGATELLCEHASFLIPALASAVSLVGCEMLVLGGEWSDSGEVVLQRLLAGIRHSVAGALSERLSVRYGQHGPDSIAGGAARYGGRLIWGNGSQHTRAWARSG